MDTSNQAPPPDQGGPPPTTAAIDIPMDQEPLNEGSGTVLEPSTTKFVSAAPSSTSVMPMTATMTTQPPSQGDSDLASFFARPVEVYSFDWTDVLNTNSHIDPWALYLNDTHVAQKLSGYKYLRADLKIQVMINGTPFHYGRILVSYEPRNGSRPGRDASTDGDYRQHSCLPHVLIDPTTNTVGLLTAPFLSPFNWIDLTKAYGAQLGILNFDTLQGLRYGADGVVPDVSIRVVAWLENVELSYPTNAALATFTAQGDEYEAGEPNSGPISGPLSKISTFSSYLGEAPIIGPFARATEMMTRGGSALASLFGFSKPRILKAPTEMVSSKAGNMVNTDAADSSISFTLGTKSELTIDPKTVGLDIDHDELAIASIANKWTIAKSTYQWPIGSTSTIATFPVGPLVGDTVVAGKHEITAMSFAAKPFLNWRGGIQFEFTIVASRYHRGRLRVSYEPDNNATGTSASTFNKIYSRVIDVSDTQVFCVTIPYFAPTGWKSVTNGLNGKLTLDIINPLVAPNINADCTIYYRVRGAEDFAVCNPGSEYRALGTYSTQGEAIVHLQGDVELHDAAERECVDLTMFTAPTPARLDDVYFADPVRSFRSLLKRQEYYGTFGWGFYTLPVDDRIVSCFQHPQYPLGRGETAYGHTRTLSGDDINTGNTVLMTYLEPAFLGKRGSCRWTINEGVESRVNPAEYGLNWQDPLVGRYTAIDSSELKPKGEFLNVIAVTTGIKANVANNILTTPAILGNSGAGVQLFPSKGDGQRVMQFEVPFHHVVKYVTNFVALGGDGGYFSEPPGMCQGFQVAQTVHNNVGAAVNVQRSYDLFTAAGEDFTMFFFLGPPVMYEIDSYTTSTSYASYTGTLAVANGVEAPGPEN